MSSSQPLLFRPSPYPDETLVSYILRLSERNYYDNPKWILSCAELSYSKLYQQNTLESKDDLHTLSQLTNLGEVLLKKMLFVESKPRGKNLKIQISGHSIPSNFVKKATGKICPACLAEAAYFRKFWHLIPATACPKHNSILIDSCPQCHQKLTWPRKSILHCSSCQFNLADSPIQHLDQDEVALSSLAYRIYNHQTEIFDSGGFDGNHPLLSINKLSDFCEIIMGVASFFLESKLFIRPEKFRDSNSPKYRESRKELLSKFIAAESNDKLHAIFTRVYQVLDCYPQHLTSFLKWLQDLYFHANLEFDPYPDLGKIVRHFHSVCYPISSAQNGLTKPIETSWQQKFMNLPWITTPQKFYLQYLTLPEVLSLHLIESPIEMSKFINKYLLKEEQIKLYLHYYLYQPLTNLLIELDTLDDNLKAIYFQMFSETN
ncbi:MAG: TniQ family protein [Limnoraphis sp.]